MKVIHFIRFSKYVRLSSFLSAVLLFILSSLTIIPLVHHTDSTEATTGTAQESTLSLDITNATASVDLTVASTNGTFASSSVGNEASFSVATNNYTGYTLSISADDNDGELVNGEESLDSISSSLTTTQFDVSANNGKWGYKPSKYRSGNTTVDNTGSSAVYLTSPTTSGTTLDVTTTPNNNANSYTIALGARADYSKEAGTYTKTFTLAAVGNPINYSITYNKNTTDTVTNMPYSSNSNVQSGDTSSTTITLSDLVPVRDDYTFKGWCSVSTNDETCSGTTYNPDGAGTNLAFGIDQTTANNTNLYAMWESTETQCDNTKLCIQYNGNGLSYSNPTRSINRVNYSSSTTQVSVTEYSHTPNISDAGVQEGSYEPELYQAEVVTIPGANSVSLTMTYSTESEGALVALIKGEWDELGEVPDDDYIASCGETTADYYGMAFLITPTENTMTCTIDTGAITIVFMDYGGSITGYGYYAMISGTRTTYNRTVDSGAYVAPTTVSSQTFLGWSTAQTASGSGTVLDVDYADESSALANLPGEEGETKNLYAVWQQQREITFVKDNNISSIAIIDPYGDTIDTITDGEESLMLGQGSTYTIVPTYASGYVNDSITKTSGVGTLTDKEFTVGTGNATISLSSRPARTIANAGTMQNVDTKEYGCPDTLTTGQVYTLTDSRDNSEYYVARLADGNCWMLDNLRLDLGDSTVLANTTADNTNASAESLSYLKNGGGTASDQWPIARINNEAWTSSSQDYYNIPMTVSSGNCSAYTSGCADDPEIGKWTKDSTPKLNNVESIYGNGSGKIGVYYNYCAASAGSYCYNEGYGSGREVEYDICPKGWRLPMSGENYNNGNREIGNLFAAYNNNQTASDTNSIQYNLSASLSGFFRFGEPRYQGQRAEIWTGTFNTERQRYALLLTPSTANNTQTTNDNGLSVRCILMSDNTYTINYHKNTNDEVTNMPQSQTATVQKDSRYDFVIPTDNIPNRSGWVFAGWGLYDSQGIPTYKYENGVFTPNKAVVYASSNSVEDLYAIWYKPQTITFTFDNHVNSVEIFDSNDDYIATVSNSGSTASLNYPVTYTIKPSYDYGYGNNAITKTVGEGDVSGKDFTVGDGPATISITSKALPTIQNYNCSTLANIGDIEEVYDSRDGETYIIGKMADNNCWMLDNLSLDLTDTAVISNITASNTNASATALNYLKNGGGTTADQWPTSGLSESNWTTGNSYSSPLINVSGVYEGIAYTKDSNFYYSGDGIGKLGAFYNYCAMSAGTYCWGNGISSSGSPSSDTKSNTNYDLDGDICPKGWRIPTGGSSGEYQSLYNIYHDDSSLGSFWTSLSLVSAGYIDNGKANGQHSAINIWSSTFYDTQGMYKLEAHTTFDLQSHAGRIFGNTVRCISYTKTVTVSLDSNTTSVSFSDGTNTYTATSNNPTVVLKADTQYTITASFNSGYDLGSWSTTQNGTLGSTIYNPTTYTVTGDSTLTVAARSLPAPPSTCSTAVPNVTYLQDITSSNKSSVLSSLTTGTAYYLRDFRDGEPYCVSKLADGKLWTIDNLRLDLTQSAVQTRLLSATTNATDTVLDYLMNGNGSSPYAAEGVTSSWSNSFTRPEISTSYKDTTATGYGSGSKKMGIYYNTCAATAGSYCYATNAGSGDASYDVCPAGWRMPTGGASSGEYYSLYTSYGSNVTNYKNALSVVLSGRFTGGTSFVGERGYFYASSYTNSNELYGLMSYSDRVVFDGRNRSYGLSVRCVVK